MVNEYENMSLYKLLNIKNNQLKYGATEEMISNLETELDILLPNEYKKFLRYSNGANLIGEDIILFSIGDDTNSEIAFEVINNDLLVIGKYNFGDLICINLKTENIIQWSSENNNVFLEHYSLKDWIISSIEEMNLVWGR